MEIRRLAEADLAHLAELYKQFWNEETLLDKMLATFRRIADNPNYILLVAEEDGSLAGSLMGIICEELYGSCRPFMVIEDVIVDKGHRRSGVGTTLMREMESHAAKAGCHYIMFVTEPDRTAAHKFYESLGYKVDAHKGFKKRLHSRLD